MSSPQRLTSIKSMTPPCVWQCNTYQYESEEDDSEYESEASGTSFCNPLFLDLEIDVSEPRDSSETDFHADLPNLLTTSSPSPFDAVSLLAPELLSSVDRYENVLNENGTSVSLGRGASGFVTKAISLESNQIVAIKRVTHHQPSIEQIQNEHWVLSLEEVKESKDIVDIYDFGSTSDGYFLSMEFMGGKSLRDLIDQRKQLEEKDIRRIVQQIARAIQTLHTIRGKNGDVQPVIHNDLKPANILLNETFDVAKLCDFGLSRQLKSEDAMIRNSQGTLKYFSPEKFFEYGLPSDIWAFGCVVFEMMGGKITQSPFGQTLFDWKTIENEYSEKCLNFVQKCLELDVNERLDVLGILDHPFLNGN